MKGRRRIDRKSDFQIVFVQNRVGVSTHTLAIVLPSNKLNKMRNIHFETKVRIQLTNTC